MRGTFLPSNHRGVFAVPLFVLACLAYVSTALPPSMLGVAWPSMRVSLHQTVGALGILLPFAITAEVLSSASAGRILPRLGVGRLLAASAALSAVGLTIFSLAPSLWVVACALLFGGTSFGLIDSSLNAFAARHFSAREISWMHGTFGLGALAGPLLVTSVLGGGVSWRWAYGIVAVIEAMLATALVLTAKRWTTAAVSTSARAHVHAASPNRAGNNERGRPSLMLVLVSLATLAVQTGIESGIGLWGYIFLTAGRGLPEGVGGVIVSGYWAAIFVGRLVLGPVAQRLGPRRVLSGGIAGVLAGTAVMTLSGSGAIASVGMIMVGLATAPVFPLLTLTTDQRVGQDDPTRTVTYQVAASALGGAGLPAVIGLLIGGRNAGALAPSLLALAVTLCLLTTVSFRSPRARRAW